MIAEIPGITPKVAEFGRKVAATGCTAVLPHLFGEPGREPSVGGMHQFDRPACISREFATLALKKTSPVTVWLRALAAHEHERCGGPGVGVVGMCFTGGFALAMMVDDTVVAPVLSQPSLPFPLLQEAQGRHRDLRCRPGQGQGPGGRRSVSDGPAVLQRPFLFRRAFRDACVGNWATASSPSSSIRRRAIPTDTRRTPTRC